MPEKHPLVKDYEAEYQREEKRIRRIADPAERIRQLAHLDAWAKDYLEEIKQLMVIEDSRVTDAFFEQEHPYGYTIKF